MNVPFTREAVTRALINVVVDIEPLARNDTIRIPLEVAEEERGQQKVDSELERVRLSLLEDMRAEIVVSGLAVNGHCCVWGHFVCYLDNCFFKQPALT